MTMMTRKMCHETAKFLRERLFELSSDIKSDGISDNGAFYLYQAAQAIDEAVAMIGLALTLEAEYNGRQENFERDQGARP